jgi:hypothetical protein
MLEMRSLVDREYGSGCSRLAQEPSLDFLQLRSVAKINIEDDRCAGRRPQRGLDRLKVEIDDAAELVAKVFVAGKRICDQSEMLSRQVRASIKKPVYFLRCRLLEPRLVICSPGIPLGYWFGI